ncbi:MAG TPA: LysM peptidoglycan-binding domain-containing protein [Anaerolineales bacterium]|nr:LysM peptidoglycan-binding domain-containing protein [Anaerolineales bacterium]
MGSVRRGGSNSFLLFLGLNVIVSLVTVLAVLTYWERRRPPAPTAQPTETVDAAARLASAVPTSTETLVPTPTPHVYKIKPNDTLFGIALELGVSLTELMEANGLTETSVLDVGQILVVPTPGGPAPTGTAEPPPSTSPTAPPAPSLPSVAIVGVTGVGDLATEAVQLINSGGTAAMAGWMLDDASGNVCILPAFTLHKGAVSINTRAGTDTVIELHCGFDRAWWRSGSTITLRDATGSIQSTFTIP